MINPSDLSSRLAADVTSLDELRHAARRNSPEALKASARQFEAVFMNMVMKSMRDATPQEGMFDSEQSRMYTSMLDQQLSQHLASRGVGLADVLIRQLSATAAMPAAAPAPAPAPASAPLRAAGSRPAPATASVAPEGGAGMPPHVRAFVQRLMPHAQEASRITGIPASFMLGQAALETGWGKHQITGADGTPSHNLFGIKATGGWSGKVVETATTEYVNGQPQTRVEKFRAYDSFAEAFRDYARLLSRNPRYQQVLANSDSAAGFAQGLQRAGYATDPNYADKLMRIIRQTTAT
jgi:flagellar protein FlgJ